MKQTMRRARHALSPTLLFLLLNITELKGGSRHEGRSCFYSVVIEPPPNTTLHTLEVRSYERLAIAWTTDRQTLFTPTFKKKKAKPQTLAKCISCFLRRKYHHEDPDPTAKN